MTNTPWNGELQYTKHATEVMKQRAISGECVESVLASPRERTQDPHDPDVERFLSAITAHCEWRLTRALFPGAW